MKIITGKIVDGQVVVEGTPFDEGSTVTVLAGDGDESFELSAGQESDLLLALEEAEQGDTMSPDELFASLRRPP
jgi:hypothetical protein